MRGFALNLTQQLLTPVIKRMGVNRAGLRSDYFDTIPSPQNALDIFQGEWYTTVPEELGRLRAGAHELHKDARLSWAISQLGGLSGLHVLELGPLEAAHSFMLERAGAASIVCIEANPRAFLKCLIIKELLHMTRAQFLCGDFVEYLRANPGRFDLVIACGVLYHMGNPAELIQLISRVTDTVFLWSHYYDQVSIARNGSLAKKFTSTIAAEQAGFHHHLFRYEYWSSFGSKRHCGGPETHAFWMERSSILDCLHWFGFNQIQTSFDLPDHPQGPSFAVLAKRV